MPFSYSDPVVSGQARFSERTDLTEHKPATANGSQSSSAQDPNAFPFLEENGPTPDQFTQTPLNTRRPTLGRFRHVSPHDATLPVRHQPDDGIRGRLSAISCRKADTVTSNQPDYTRPETHQNLIHPDKEQNHRYER